MLNTKYRIYFAGAAFICVFPVNRQPIRGKIRDIFYFLLLRLIPLPY
jgi:hypothetical protein